MPGARAFFAAAGLARVGIAMTGLGLVWLVHAGTGSYAVAGLVTGGFALAEAAVGPQVARLVDRHGQTRVLPPLLAAHGVAVALLVVLTAAHAPTGLLVGCGALAGGTIPQAGALSSARWSNLLAGDPLLGTAFALESLTNAVAFLVGPTLVGTVAALVDPVVASALATAFVLAGGFVLAALTATAPPPANATARDATTITTTVITTTARAAAPRPRSGLRTRPFAVLVVVNTTLGVMFGASGVAVTAFALDHGVARLAGPLNSVSSVASLAAGLVYGHRAWPSAPAVQLRRALWLLAAGTVGLVLAASPWALAAALVVPGLAIAPTLVLSTVLTQARVDRAVLTQAFTWLNSASAAGYAGAAALSGVLADALGTRWSFGLAAAATLLGAAAVTATGHLLSRTGPVGTPVVARWTAEGTPSGPPRGGG